MQCVVLVSGQTPGCALCSVSLTWGMVYLNPSPLPRKGPHSHRVLNPWVDGVPFKTYFLLFSRNEISKILKSSYLRGMNLAIFFAASKIMIFITFIITVVLDNRITASRVFLVVMLFETVRFTGTLYFPMAIEKVSETVVSIKRIKVWWKAIFFLVVGELYAQYLIWCHCVPVWWHLTLSAKAGNLSKMSYIVPSLLI